MKYHAFYFAHYRAKGGLGDYLDSFDDIGVAKKAVEDAINDSSLGYWGSAHGQIIEVINGKLETVAYFVGYLKGNVHACKIDRQCAAWGKDEKETTEVANNLAKQHNPVYLR